MKKILFLTLLLLFQSNLFAQSKQSLSINQAVDYALKNNYSVTAAKEMKKSASYASAAAKGNYLPSIDVVALATKINDSVSIDLNNIRSAIIGASVASYSGAGGANPSAFQNSLEQSMPSFEQKLLNDTAVRVTATAVQPIFTGFKVSANAQVKKLEREVSELNFQNAKNLAITTTIEDYYRVKLAENIILIMKDFEKNMGNHLSNAKALFKNGIISKANLLRFEVAFADAQKDYQKSIRDKELASLLLTNTIGIETEELFLSSPMEMMKNQKDIDYYTAKAMQNNNSIKLLNSKKAMLKQKHKAAVGNLLPSIAAVGEYQILQDKLSLLEPEWTVGLRASMNVFSGGKDINEIKAAKAEIASIDAEIENINKLIRTAVKKLYHQCETAKSEYRALESNEKLAKENIKVYSSSFKAGMATSLEVVDAELALAKIKIDKAKAVFDYNSAFAGLLNICSISEEEFTKKPEEK